MLIDFHARHLLRAGQAFFRSSEWTYDKAYARDLLWQAQRGVCICCTRRLMPNVRYPNSGDRSTVDHVWPQAFGGPDKLGNLVLLTHNCNARKHQRWPSRQEVEALRAINVQLGWVTPRMLYVNE